ncbi:MAG: acyltransferase family protein, partial [Atopostipes suicloacalis]|nr:acyltransferase family protein [Atopostipes suicloacalis]
MNQENIKKFGRIQSIDYLKAFAIVLVILTHALTKTQRLKIAGPFWISMAVPIFMIISGFTNTL